MWKHFYMLKWPILSAFHAEREDAVVLEPVGRNFAAWPERRSEKEQIFVGKAGLIRFILEHFIPDI